MRRTGILRKTPLKQSSGKERRELFNHLRDDAFREWIRGQSCLVSGRQDSDGDTHHCWGRIEACHVRTKATGAGDRMNLFPGCTLAHRIFHTVGVKSFQRRYRVRLEPVAATYDAEYEKECLALAPRKTAHD